MFPITSILVPVSLPSPSPSFYTEDTHYAGFSVLPDTYITSAGPYNVHGEVDLSEYIDEAQCVDHFEPPPPRSTPLASYLWPTQSSLPPYVSLMYEETSSFGSKRTRSPSPVGPSRNNQNDYKRIKTNTGKCPITPVVVKRGRGRPCKNPLPVAIATLPPPPPFQGPLHYAEEYESMVSPQGYYAPGSDEWSGMYSIQSMDLMYESSYSSPRGSLYKPGSFYYGSARSSPTREPSLPEPQLQLVPDIPDVKREKREGQKYIENLRGLKSLAEISPAGRPLPVAVPNLTKNCRGRKVVTIDSAPTSSKPKPRRAKSDVSTTEANKGRTYLCVVEGCGKLFVRGEHLKRHVRSIHTDENPYTCPRCFKSFNRKDNLKQHDKTCSL